MTYVAIYLAIVMVLALPVILKAGKLAGVYVVAVTLPWSGLAVLIGVAIDGIFDTAIFDHWYVGASAIILGAVLNSILFYWVVASAERKNSSVTPDEASTSNDA